MSRCSAIKIFIAYETAAVAVRAKIMAEELAAELQSACDSWPMDLLAHPDLCRQAAAAAAEADMIIIAASGAEESPSHARNWIETWLPQKKNGPTALVLLLDQEGESLGSPPPFCVYLLQVAERGNMDFFCSASQWALRGSSHNDELIPRHQTACSRKITAPSLPGRACGIND
jgi:hypothetical protein